MVDGRLHRVNEFSTGAEKEEEEKEEEERLFTFVDV